MLLLIIFECLVCLFIWWRGVVIALGDQPRHRRWDMVQRQRRADWARNELQQRPVWWVMLSGLLLLVLADWFTDKWAQAPVARRDPLDGRDGHRAGGRRGAYRALRRGYQARQGLADRSREGGRG